MGQALYPYPPVPEPPLLPLLPKEQATLVTQDGVTLDADIYRPQGEGPFPVLLMRQPYGRAIASTVVYAHPRWYAAHGYIVVVQDVRGRGTSGGTFDLFAQEAADGRATLEWVAALPGSTGDVGMYGFSYQGMTQLYAASAQPPALKVLCPAMVAPDLYSHWAYEGGAFCLQTNLAWALQLAAETARRQGTGQPTTSFTRQPTSYLWMIPIQPTQPCCGNWPRTPSTMTGSAIAKPTPIGLGDRPS